MVSKAELRRRQEHKDDLQRSVWIAVIFFVLGVAISFAGIPQWQDVKWSANKLLVKSVGESYLPDVFSFPIELVNTSAYPITQISIKLQTQGGTLGGNQQNSNFPIELIPPKESAPHTIILNHGIAIGYALPRGQTFGMFVFAHGTYAFPLWKQEFDRKLYFVGVFDGENTIHWSEQTPPDENR